MKTSSERIKKTSRLNAFAASSKMSRSDLPRRRRTALRGIQRTVQMERMMMIMASFRQNQKRAAARRMLAYCFKPRYGHILSVRSPLKALTVHHSLSSGALQHYQLAQLRRSDVGRETQGFYAPLRERLPLPPCDNWLQAPQSMVRSHSTLPC